MPIGGNKLGQAYAKLRLESSEFNRDLAASQRGFKRKTQKMQRRAKKFGRTMKRAWKTAAIGTAVLTAGVAKAVSMYTEFEDAQVELTKKLSTTRDNIKGLTNDLTMLSTKLPTTRQELVEIAASAAQVGVQRENIAAFAKTMIQWREATGQAVDRAATFFGAITGISGAARSSVVNLGSALAYLLDNFPVKDADKLTETVQRLGTQLFALGESQAGVAGLAGAIASLKPERPQRVATRTVSAFRDMTSEMGKWAEAAGMTKEQLKTLFDEAPTKALRVWIKNFKEYNNVGESASDTMAQLTELMSSAAAQGILPLVQASDLLNRALDKSAEKYDEGTTLQEKYAIGLTRLSTQLKITKGNLQTTAQAFGGIFAPAIRNLNENVLQPFTTRLAYIMTQSEETREAIRKLVLRMLKIGAVITTIGLVAKAIMMLASPVFQVMALAGLLWAAYETNLFYIKDYIDNNLLGEDGVFGQLKDAIEKLSEGDVLGAISEVGDALGAAFDFDFDFGFKDDPSKDIKSSIQEQLGIGEKEANWVETGIRAAVGGAIWYGTGSLGLAALGATIGLDWSFNVLSGLSIRKKIAKKLPIGQKGATWAEVGLRAAIGAAVWYGTGSIGAGTLAATVGLNFLFQFASGDMIDWPGWLDFLDTKLGDIPWAEVFGTPDWAETLGEITTSVWNDIMDWPGWGEIMEKGLAEWIAEKITEQDWMSIGNTIKEGLIQGLKGIGTAIWKFIWGGAQGGPVGSPGFGGGATSEMWFSRQEGGPMGLLPGYGGGDKIPALLEQGEFIWPKEMVRQYPGIIKGMWQGFQGGGETKLTSGTGQTATGEDYKSSALRIIQRARKELLKLPGTTKESIKSVFDPLEAVVKGWTEDMGTFKAEWEEMQNKAQEYQEQVASEMAGPGGTEWQNKLKDLSIKSIDKFKELAKSAKDSPEKLQALSMRASEVVAAQKEYIAAREKFGFSSEKAREKLNKFREALGLATSDLQSKLQKVGSALGTVTSGLMQVAQATGKLTAGQSARLGGVSSAAQSALSGNWLQAIMDLFTGFMKGWIEDLKAKKEKLQEQLDATFSMANEGLQTFVNELQQATNQLAGPFGSAIGGALDGLTGFFKMTQEFVQGNTIKMMETGFNALMTTVSGVVSSFVGLLQNSKQWEALQNELDPIWKALADAFGTLLTPVVALARWLRKQLGITKEVTKQFEDLNVPTGFKRTRKVWEAAAPGQPAGATGGGMQIPEWAKQIIEPIKNKIAPYLKGSKDFLQRIKEWSRGIWTWLQNLILDWIPKIANGIRVMMQWVANIDWRKILTYIAAMGKWFIENFPGAWEKFKKKFDEFWKGTFSSGGLLETIKSIDKQLAAIAKSMGAAVTTVSLGGIGAAIGGTLFGPMGAVIGGGIGLGLGGLASWLGFQGGGIVPGPIGKPQPAVVHGGETVIPPGMSNPLGGKLDVMIQTSEDGLADALIESVQVRNKRETGSRSTSAAINRRKY